MHISLSLADDPLSSATAPPPDETLEQRRQRLQDEKEAKFINDEIDAQLKQDRKTFMKEHSNAVRVLLLGKEGLVLPPCVATGFMNPLLFTVTTGQSESGKSTTLKSV